MCSLVTPGGEVGCRCSSAGSSSLSSAHGYLSVGLGTHLLDLTSGVWSQEERLFHINVLEMRAFVLSLAAFPRQLARQSVVLMSDNATVVSYLRNQRERFQGSRAIWLAK